MGIYRISVPNHITAENARDLGNQRLCISTVFPETLSRGLPHLDGRTFSKHHPEVMLLTFV